MYGRPWAEIWHKYWEQGMPDPDAAKKQEELFNFDDTAPAPGSK